jgi:hypothetical protein
VSTPGLGCGTIETKTCLGKLLPAHVGVFVKLQLRGVSMGCSRIQTVCDAAHITPPIAVSGVQLLRQALLCMWPHLV